MNIIDIRSDTVTWPTPDMRRAMAEAVLGDDVYGEDPTVNELEAQAAARFGKEAALFVTSGTMGNVTSALAQCERGDEIILGDRAHMFVYEAGNPATVGGVHSRTLHVQPDGTLPLDEIEAAIRDPNNLHYPRTRLICLENTQGGIGGVALPPEYINAVGKLAHEHGLGLHIDGARIFNAATATHCDVRDLVAAADSVSFCLSKGLCAPVGSLIVGSKPFIAKARRVRKWLGGAMRQAGVLAAAGLIALNEMPKRLQVDHDNARALALGLSKLPGVQINLQQVQTNMVFIKLGDDCPYNSQQISDKLNAHNIRINNTGKRSFRAVTHYWITREHIDQVISAFGDALR
ncbi:MAG: low-specificity L-threonine aldolase [Aggregatilineales bacterium]